MGILNKIEEGITGTYDAARNWVRRHPALTGAIAGGAAGSVVPVVGTVVGAVAGATIGAHVRPEVRPDPVKEEKPK